MIHDFVSTAGDILLLILIAEIVVGITCALAYFLIRMKRWNDEERKMHEMKMRSLESMDGAYRNEEVDG